uniref:Bromo domain-containing protein n=1 Tax=Kwoniella pini CBS 10737 TaxID=1296096 RepID=A0A1B9HUH3_9TREE|nr:uncharacterized protein I206_07306 [Kwoniella pini CBS 10737]OCF46919.1 hypothetical protein I206_07306 [Kwoniella pini CBS 10737]
MSSETVETSRRSSRRDAPSSSSAIKAESPSKGNASEDGMTTEKIRKKRLDVNPALILNVEGGRSKRRRTTSQEPEHNPHPIVEDKDSSKDPVKAKELGYVIYRKIMESKSSDGENIAQPFIKLPNKRALPDYYETIKHPMSLEIVHQKLDASEYQSLKDVCADLGQIFNNAKRYNVKDSLIFQYAKKLHVREGDAEGEDEEVDAEGEVDPEGDIEMEDITTTGNTSGVPTKIKRVRRRGAYMKDGPSVYKLIKPVLRAIKEAKARDGSGREIAGIFSKLPSRKDFPDYYTTIRHPISLEEIESKQVGRRYESFQEFADDIELMVKNGMQYNEDGSEVYRDAQQIRTRPPRPSSTAPVPTRIHHISTPTYSHPQPAYSHSPVGGPMPLPFPIPTSAPSPGLTPYSAGPSRSPQPPIPGIQGHRAYLPALPPGVVTEEIVATLERYPPYERQAWVQSLSPLAVNMYRTMLATNEARKRGQVPGLPPTPQPHTPYSPAQHPQQQPSPIPSQQILQQTSMSSPAQIHIHQTPHANHQTPSQSHVQIQNQTQNKPIKVEKPKPPIPTIKHIDFTFSSASNISSRQTIRLKNSRGLVTHAIILKSNTSEIELIAYIDDSPISSHSENEGKTISNGNGNDNHNDNEDSTIGPVPVPVLTPELSLRINGNQGSLPRFIYNNNNNNNESIGVKQGEKPKGMKWTLHISTSKIESKIEIVSTKPGTLAETTTIFVNRQF